MKKFQLRIKDPDEDFILTDDLWLTVAEQIQGCRIIKLHNKSELLLCLVKEVISLDLKLGEHTSLLPIYYDLKKKIITEGSIFYFNTHEGTLFFHNPLKWFCVILKRSRKEMVELDREDGNLAIHRDDLFLLMTHSLKKHEKAQSLIDLVCQKKSITYTLFQEIQNHLQENHIHSIPLFSADCSDHLAYTFPIKSSLKTVGMTIDMIKNKVLKFHSEKIWQIETVMHEALVNAITYGNEMDYEKQVIVSFEVGTRGLRVTIKDGGEGFDVNNVSVPVGQEALERINGRGIYIMQKFSDAMYYNPSGNEVLLFFNF